MILKEESDGAIEYDRCIRNLGGRNNTVGMMYCLNQMKGRGGGCIEMSTGALENWRTGAHDCVKGLNIGVTMTVGGWDGGGLIRTINVAMERWSDGAREMMEWREEARRIDLVMARHYFQKERRVDHRE